MADPPRDTAPEVRLRAITTILDDEAVLHALTLTLQPGRITVLMGPSGAGKTTLVRHLAGLLAPDAGTVVIGDDDVWAADEPELRRIRRGMSVMLGGCSLFDSSLFASLTALDNVTYGLGTRGVPTHRHDDLAMARLHELGLADMAEMLPAAMPAHARKRLALARALVVEAPLLILDEIETGLDSVHTGRVLAALRDQHHRTRATMLVTTHDIGLARELGGSLAILCNGRIVARGNAVELLRDVVTADDFDHRFRLADFVGPPRLADAVVARDGRRKEPRSWSIDERVLWTALAGLMLVVLFILFALLTAGPRASF